MSDLPTHVDIHEEGPREGFQIEPGPISTADKIKLIEALAETGLHHIQAASFVSPRIVPGWADAEDVVAGRFGARLFGRRTRIPAISFGGSLENRLTERRALPVLEATQALIDMEMTLATGVHSIAGAVDLLAAMPADTWAVVTSGRRPMALAPRRWEPPP